MKIENGKPVGGVEQKTGMATPGETPAPAVRTDRVSTDETRNVAAMVEGAKRAASSNRAARLREIESAIKSGSFKPDPSRIAEQILAAAEVDVRLRALVES